MNAQQKATIQALKDGNAWLINALQENHIALAEARGQVETLKELNKRLEQRLRARGKA